MWWRWKVAGLNKTKIEWCTKTFNPVTGCLYHCQYCYARKIAMRFQGHFKPTFHPDRLGAPVEEKKPQRIFVCSMADLFGKWVPDEWIERVFAACEKAPWHTYYFLTKNPDRYYRLFEYGWREKIPSNWWLGHSTNGISNHGALCDEFIRMHRFISAEPLLFPLSWPQINIPRWIIVGAQTNPTILPKREWVVEIRGQCKKFNIPLFEKNSLAPLDLPGGLTQGIPI